MTIDNAPQGLEGGLDTSHQSGSTPPPAPLGQGAATIEAAGSSRRVRGLDAARGFALFGMIIVHLMLGVDPATGGMSRLYQLFAGHAAPLFGLLAGVSLALITGGVNPHTGRRLKRDRVSIATRAALLLMLGLALNLLPLNVFSILPFYAVYFLVGLLFTGLGVRALFAWAGIFALGGPVVIYLVNGLEIFGSAVSPDLTDLFTEPVMTAMSLTITGYYPAITWMAYILLGIALGRLDLRELSVQIRMCVWGGLAAGTAMVVSELLLFHFGAYERISAASPMSEEEIGTVLEFGGVVPAYSWWWLVTDGPHSNTPFSIVGSAGFAIFTLGAFLLAAHVVESLLAPIAAAGSMTFTFYTAHLLLVTFVDVWASPVFWIFAQIIFVITFGLIWRAAFGRGPLESLMTKVSKGVGRMLVPDTFRQEDEK